MKDSIYIGIDFSLSSPGVCLIRGKDHKWISVYRTVPEDHQKLLSKKDGPFGVLSASKSTSINLQDKPLKHGSTYSATERLKLESSTAEARNLIDLIKGSMKDHQGDIYVAIEGLSFGAPGNTLIDICMATGIVRSLIISDLLRGDVSKFFVFSPGTIKKFAGSGSFKKPDMYKALIEHPDLQHLELVQLMNTYKSSWITPGGAVHKPVEDIVDATWCALLLKNAAEGLFTEELSKVKTTKSKKKGGKKVA